MKIVDHQRTKIVATVGPACSSYENLLELIQSGVDVFRLNFSHGSHEDHLEVINRLIYINEKYNLHISILADLQGPKLRVGKIENNALPLEEGDVVTFVNEPCIGNKDRIYMSYPEFPTDVEVGEIVLVDDGKLVFEVIETNKRDTVRLKTVFGGVLSSNKGVNLPNTNVSLPSLTEKDLADLVALQKTKAESENSWSVDMKDIDQSTFDLSAKNPNKKEETALRQPQEILAAMKALDEESADILNSILELI